MNSIVMCLFMLSTAVAFSSEETKPAKDNTSSIDAGTARKDRTENKDSKAYSQLLTFSWKEIISSDDLNASNGPRAYSMTLTFFSDMVIMEMETPAKVVTTDIIPLKKLGDDKVHLFDGKTIPYSIKDGKLFLDYGKDGIDKFMKVKRSKNAEDVNQKKAKVIFSMAYWLTYPSSSPV